MLYLHVEKCCNLLLNACSVLVNYSDVYLVLFIIIQCICNTHFCFLTGKRVCANSIMYTENTDKNMFRKVRNNLNIHRM